MTENSEAGATPLADQLREITLGLVVLEVTGGLEREVVLTLAERDAPVVIAKARQVRDFAKATGRLAKTDQLAPLLLAVFESGAPDGFSSSRRTGKTQESRARGA